jgi:excisionase family DNA binding protein
MSSNLTFKKKCDFCGNEFEAKTLYTRYCSHTCNSRHYKILKRQEKIAQVIEEPKEQPKKEVIETASLSQKEFLSIDETAALIGASRRTIYRLIENKKLKVTKIGSRTIIKRCEIDKLFQS